MTDDPNDKRFDDFSHWPRDALPGNDAGAIEVRRRAFAAAFKAFVAFWDGAGQEVDVTWEMEAFAVALREEQERLGIEAPDLG